ncbi:MAG TPA: GNAT family N-acetyltransferase, partial [Chthonomonadaceae bacterium]|nr:GNAT family N-acetyltransferase [Chthonomonadaceae bacterium]
HGSRDLEEPEEWLTANADRMVVYGGHDAAGLQASVVVVDYRLHFGPDVLVLMGAIEGVACLPASRGRGYAGTMLKHVLEQMRDAGQVTSLLEPFSWDYYRRFGWEWIGARRSYAVPARILKASPETERVRVATLQDRPKIMDAYTRFAARYRGLVVRTDRHWAKILDDSKKEFTYTYLYEPEGQAEGYLTYRGGKGEETRLREFISLTPRAQRALLGLLRRHEMQVEKFTWSAPPDDGLWSRDYHWDIETKTRPQLMGRVVDVPAALQAWRPAHAAQGRLKLGVHDECAPWNTATWQIDFSDGRVEARSTSADPQVSLDIQALSQAYFGTPAVSDLRTWGRLQVHEEAGYQALVDLLAGPMFWINDGF